MLNNYLNLTKNDYLVNRKELLANKQNSLDVLHIEYNYSFSPCSLSRKGQDSIDLNLLKTNLSSTQTRIEQLKIELIDLENELLQGTLDNNDTLNVVIDHIGDYSIDEALNIVNELKSIRKSIQFGEKERKDLIIDKNELVKQVEEADENEVNLKGSFCINDLTSLRIEYENLRNKLKEIQLKISNIDIKVSKSQLDLSIVTHNDVESKDTCNFIRLANDRNSLLRQLKLVAKQMALMETHLKSVSLSTLSSLSSESTKSSLNSLNSLNIDYNYLAKYLNSIVNLNSCSYDSGCLLDQQDPIKIVSRSGSDTSTMVSVRKNLFNRNAQERRSLRIKRTQDLNDTRNELELSLKMSQIELEKLLNELNSLKIAKQLNNDNKQNSNERELNERIKDLMKKSSIKIEKLKQMKNSDYLLKKCGDYVNRQDNC